MLNQKRNKIFFQKNYFIAAIVLFLIEVCIALFLHDKIIRPYIGDVLVVVLLYCCIKSFYNGANLTIALIVLAFAFLIEYLQYLNFLDLIGVRKSHFTNIVLGNSFSWLDILCYCIGTLGIVIVENFYEKKELSSTR